jgi:hypothetical protein
MSANGDLHDAAAALTRSFGPLRPTGWVWREVAFGPCVRCYWPSHTLAGGSPVHPFCYLNPDPVPPWSEWVRRRDGTGEWGNRRNVEVDHRDDGERQWCATEGRWFEPTPERLQLCVEHAAEVVARWR